jgi:hypothetical protein
MMTGSRMLRRALVLGGLFAVLAVVGSVAWATTSASAKFVACARKSGGALRLVAAAKDCRKTERAVIWSANGQPGPRGPAGPKGAAGQDGADGLDGVDGLDGDDGDDGLDGLDGLDGAPGPASEPKWHYVFKTTTADPSTTTSVFSDACTSPLPPQAVNGGYKLTSAAAAFVRVISTAPEGIGATASRWEVQFENTSGSPQPVTVWVLCATGTAG